MSQIRGRQAQGMALSSCSEWWAVLGSNQWPLPCETEVGCLRINDMRAVSPIATRTWYHVMSFDITQCHERTVPKLSQRPGRRWRAREEGRKDARGHAPSRDRSKERGGADYER